MRNLMMIFLLSGLLSASFATWEAIGPEGGYLRAMAVAASNEDIIYAATYGSVATVVKSIDGGDSWSVVGTISGYVFSMAVDPTNQPRYRLCR